MQFFNVAVSGDAPLSYQWQLDGTNIGGATGSSLVLTNVQSLWRNDERRCRFDSGWAGFEREPKRFGTDSQLARCLDPASGGQSEWALVGFASGLKSVHKSNRQPAGGVFPTAIRTLNFALMPNPSGTGSHVKTVHEK